MLTTVNRHHPCCLGADAIPWGITETPRDKTVCLGAVRVCWTTDRPVRLSCKAPQQRQQFRIDLRQGKGARFKPPFGHDDNIKTRRKGLLPKADTFPDESAHTVAPNGIPRFFADRRAQPPRIVPSGAIGNKENKIFREKTAAFIVTMYKLRPLGQPVSAGEAQTVNFLRPLARLRRIISRPAAVLMRARNPCTRFRLILLGWYVLFMDSSLAKI